MLTTIILNEKDGNKSLLKTTNLSRKPCLRGVTCLFVCFSFLGTSKVKPNLRTPDPAESDAQLVSWGIAQLTQRFGDDPQDPGTPGWGWAPFAAPACHQPMPEFVPMFSSGAGCLTAAVKNEACSTAHLSLRRRAMFRSSWFMRNRARMIFLGFGETRRASFTLLHVCTTARCVCLQN